MNVLVDRHHHALYYSLQLLFEDRLGLSMYTPVGHEWWDAHYWRFGAGYGDDRLAQQFLSLDGWEQAGDVYRTVDGHHPERDIRGVTLEQARRMPWAFAVATVQDNQRGFSAFARDTGAQYVLHAGNINQQIDWSLKPLVISTNEAPLQGRAVRVHQEIDRRTFAYREPSTSRSVSSFVNCFASTPCHADFQAIEALTPGWAFYEYGIDGADGNVASVGEIAMLMADSAFGWHDKHQGDGFGHVIHDWAAIGRPIIGHASHYRGLMAERFWQDGVTCIDLDRHSHAEVAEMIRTMAPAKHREMCEAIRAEFDRIEWDAEAEEVRGLLGLRVAVAA
jgi:hypothetical protein